MNRESKIYVAGHRGMVGSAVCRRLTQDGYENLVHRSRDELDLLDQAAVSEFFESERPEFVFLCAAKVGGILANDTFPAEFVRENLLIQCNVIDAAYRFGCSKLLFLGSSCIYPKFARQPISEDALLTGPLEPTNQAYAIAKIAGIEMCRAYRRQYGFNAISGMPTNLYGPGDNFDLKASHVVPALIRRFHEAKVSGQAFVVVWGSGKPRREFLHVDDLAEALVFLMNHYEGDQHINVGVGQDISIRELAEIIRAVVGFSGELKFDDSQPDGTPRKLLDVSRLSAMGWSAGTSLRDGLSDVYEWFCVNEAQVRGRSA